MELRDLFTNEIDFNTFCNLKAKGRILATEKAIEDFKNEIKESIDKCTEIFDKYHAETNFVTELMDLETKFQHLEHQKYNSAELDELTSKKEELYEAYNRFVNSLPLSVKEDLEFYSKRVLDREERLDQNNEVISELEHYFPNAREIDVDKTFNTLDVLRSAMEYLNPDLPDLNIKEDKTVSMPYVTKITEAPDELISSVEDKKEPLDDVEIPKEPEHVSEINHDNSFFDPLDAFSVSIENNNIDHSFEHVEEEKPEKIEITEENISPLFTDLKPEPIEEPKPEVDNVLPEESITSLFAEEEPKEETTPVVESEPVEIVPLLESELGSTEPETFTPIEQGPTDALVFTINNGVTLTALAEAACGNANGWKDIYENNKQIIDERLQLNGMTIEEAKDNDIALTGLKLAIPNVYNSLKEEDNSKTKVA